jgi:hypothetical protein
MNHTADKETIQQAWLLLRAAARREAKLAKALALAEERITGDLEALGIDADADLFVLNLRQALAETQVQL